MTDSQRPGTPPVRLTVAHEAGHHLGFHSNAHPPSGIMSVCTTGVDRPRVHRQPADPVNP